jgi:hypothetical protein
LAADLGEGHKTTSGLVLEIVEVWSQLRQTDWIGFEGLVSLRFIFVSGNVVERGFGGT